MAVVGLAGSLARIYCGDLASLKPLLQQLEAILLNGGESHLFHLSH